MLQIDTKYYKFAGIYTGPEIMNIHLLFLWFVLCGFH